MLTIVGGLKMETLQTYKEKKKRYDEVLNYFTRGFRYGYRKKPPTCVERVIGSEITPTQRNMIVDIKYSNVTRTGIHRGQGITTVCMSLLLDYFWSWNWKRELTYMFLTIGSESQTVRNTRGFTYSPEHNNKNGEKCIKLGMRQVMKIIEEIDMSTPPTNPTFKGLVVIEVCNYTTQERYIQVVDHTNSFKFYINLGLYLALCLNRQSKNIVLPSDVIRKIDSFLVPQTKVILRNQDGRPRKSWSDRVRECSESQ